MTTNYIEQQNRRAGEFGCRLAELFYTTGFYLCRMPEEKWRALVYGCVKLTFTVRMPAKRMLELQDLAWTACLRYLGMILRGPRS